MSTVTSITSVADPPALPDLPGIDANEEGSGTVRFVAMDSVMARGPVARLLMDTTPPRSPALQVEVKCIFYGESGTADSPFAQDTLADMLRRLGSEGEDEALLPKALDAVDFTPIVVDEGIFGLDI